jgi:hypothetical protein
LHFRPETFRPAAFAAYLLLRIILIAKVCPGN